MPLKNKPKKSLDYDQTVFTFKMNEASFKSFPKSKGAYNYFRVNHF